MRHELSRLNANNENDRALKGYFTALESDENRGVNTTRGLACEYVAWKFVTHLSERELINYLLYELPPILITPNGHDEETAVPHHGSSLSSTRLLDDTEVSVVDSSNGQRGTTLEDTQDSLGRDDHSNKGFHDFAASFDNLNALEIAAVTNAKKFLSQRAVQRIVENIWRGDIVFWETLGVGSEKEAKVYNKQ